MIFFRYIFLFTTVVGCTSIGFLLSKTFSDRLKELNTLAKFINILQNKIKFTHKPLGEICYEISKFNEEQSITEIFSKTSQKLEDKNIEQAWSEAITEQKYYLNLKKEDISLIKSLGNVLGKSDVDGQMSEINQFTTLLKSQIKIAEEEKNKNEKMYKSLGTIIGLAIVILLY